MQPHNRALPLAMQISVLKYIKSQSQSLFGGETPHLIVARKKALLQRHHFRSELFIKFNAFKSSIISG